MEIQDIIQALNGVKSGVQFASIIYTAKESGETARHKILVGSSYRNALQKSLDSLSKARYSDPIKRAAQAELIESFRHSIDCIDNEVRNKRYAHIDTYAETDTPQVKRDIKNGGLKLIVPRLEKIVLKPGIFRKVNSAPKTIEKNKIRNRLPVGKYKTFILSPDMIARARVNGETIEFD